jgi:pullulanase/glycogen debranching enzyme
MPRGVVIDRSFDWGKSEARPRHGLADTVIYETQVRALTCQHPASPRPNEVLTEGLRTRTCSST